MARKTKFVEIKFCKKCQKNLNYKKFRKVNPLKKVPDKGKFVGWTDISDATVDEISKVADFYEKLLKNK